MLRNAIALLTVGSACAVLAQQPGATWIPPCQVDALWDVARREHPEAFTPEGRKGWMLIVLDVDVECKLKRHGITRRTTDRLTVDSAFALVFPADRGEAGPTGGIAGDPRMPGDPMLVWRVRRPTAEQAVQYRSPAGIGYWSQVDTGSITRARAALAADSTNVQRYIDLGVAQSGARQFREAIETFTRGLAIAPENAMLLRWRGHRYLSMRQLDRALTDLSRGAQLDSTIYGIWYHLGIVRFARGEFGLAAEAFARAQARAPEAGELAGSTDWLWMSLSRAGRNAAAQAMLDRKPDSLPVTNAYAQRLRLYRGQITPDQVFTAADTGDVQVATLSFGLGNWYLLRGDTANGRRWFERSVASGGWPAFGFILSEIDLRRLRAQR